MKAMLISDLIIMRRNLLQMLMTCLIVVLVISLAMNSTLAPIGGCFGAMIPLLYLFTIAGYDEMNEWQGFKLTLPTSRKDIIIGRYASLFVVALASILIGIAVSYVVGGIASVIGSQNGAEFGNLWNYSSPEGAFLSTMTLATNPPEIIIGSSIAGASMALFICAITLPLIAKLGLTKSVRFVPIVVVVIFLITFASFGEGGPLASYVPDFFQWLFTSTNAVIYLIAGLGIGSLILFAVSMLLAIKLYEHREF